MLLLTPSIAECPIRAAYQAWTNHLSDLVTASTLMVWVGVALEVPESIHDVGSYLDKKWFKRKQLADQKPIADIFPTGDFVENVRHPKWLKKLEEPAKIFAGIGLILVIAGVVGEWVNGAELEEAHNALHRFDEVQVLAAQVKAGDAAKSVKTAREELGALREEARDIREQLDAASAKMGRLQKDIIAQGPRAKLLVKAAPDIVKAVSPFAGQKVRLFVCGQQGAIHQETLDTWGAIANILGSDVVAGIAGAKWKILSPNLGFAPNCGAAGGLGQGQGVVVIEY